MLETNLTYIGVFLTLSCNYHCPYCINRHGELKPRKLMSDKDWIEGLSRIHTRPDLPITLQGGEPTIHPGFYNIVGTLGLLGKEVDILTNFNVDVDEWISRINPKWLCRPSPYPSIRVSYHPGQSPVLGLLWRVWQASQNCYPIGIWAVDHPTYKFKINLVRRLCKLLGIKFRLKEFLGWYDDAFYGEYKYPGAVSQPTTKTVECKSNELLIAPDGYIHRCHADLYAGRDPIGHILNANLPKIGEWRSCSHFGQCGECDVKLKTDRFQKGGFCAVEIRKICQ